jgi:excisionase family DNA binding protein
MKIEPEDLQPFRDLFRDVIREELNSCLRDIEKGLGEDVVFDLPGLCDYLKVTPKWVYEQTHLKTIPHIKLSGKVLRFKKRAIDKWLETMRTPAIGQPTGKFKLLK